MAFDRATKYRLFFFFWINSIITTIEKILNFDSLHKREHATSLNLQGYYDKVESFLLILIPTVSIVFH